MNSDSPNLRQRQEEKQVSSLDQQQQSQAGQEFSSVEEMIRFDAGQTTPPETIADRLKESINREPAPPRSWWRRLFGLKN